jgi:hypothetical protein
VAHLNQDLELLQNRLKKSNTTTLIGILPKLTPEQQQWAMTMTDEEILITERLLQENPPRNPVARWNGIMDDWEYTRNF